MKRKNWKLVIMMLVITLCFGCVTTVGAAAPKAKLKTQKVTMVKGAKKKIKIVKKKKNAKYTYRSNKKKVASVNKNGMITAKKAGKAKIVVREKRKGKTRKLGTVRVTVKKKAVKPTKTPLPTIAPTKPPVPTGEPEPTTEPTETPVPTATPTPEPAEEYVPVEQYIQDTNYEVPSDLRMKKSDVDYGEVVDIQYESTATNSTRKAKVILPAGYTEEKQYPVMYLLHGIFGNETSLYNDGVQTVIGNTIASGDAEEMIVVLPNACANAEGAGEGFNLEHYQAYDNFINDFKDCLMPYINENFSTATGRENTAISGFSMGGRVTLQIGFTLQDTVRYVGALCPAFGILEYENYGVHEDGLFTEDTFTLQQEYWNDMLVFIAAGTNDDIVRTEPKRYHDALEQNQVPHIYYATQGINWAGETGDGGHSSDSYMHGMYNFMRRIFHKK